MPPDSSLPPPTLEAAAHSTALLQRIHDELERAGGWISFARYMELALYAPGLGYYDAGAAKLGTPGDFITAPELSDLFSATLARQVAQILDHTGGEVIELGAGSGRMAATILRTLDELGHLPQRYAILEPSADLRERQRSRLAALPPHLGARVEWLDTVPERIAGAVLANEVLDALPVHLVVWSEDGIAERGVGWHGKRLAFSDRPLRDAVLQAEASRIEVPPPYVGEINLAAPALIRTLAPRLERGALLFVDYGFGRAEYYHPQRNRGTLMCHYRHRAHDDPFLHPGLQDITAHVDFTAVACAGVESGLALLGYTTQAHFLINLGITELLARTPSEEAAAYLPRAAEVQKLLSPAEMGELFKVLALGREVPPLAGFVTGDLSRLL